MVSEEINIVHMIINAGLMVQFVLLLLLFFSITSWAIITIKFRYIRKAYRESAFFKDYFWKSRDLSSAFKQAKRLQGSPIARLFRIGYAELKKTSSSREAELSSLDKKSADIDTVKRTLNRTIMTEVTGMTQWVPFLATTGNTTPFIGLFGTVWGIMNSFHSIGQSGSASLAVVAPGISEALIATAAGLAVAIPAVIAFNYFMYRIRIIESELQSFAADFLNIIEQDMIRIEEC